MTANASLPHRFFKGQDDLHGPLPAELQLYTTYTAALIAGTSNAAAARALIRYLAGPAGRKSFAERGLEAPD